MRKAKPEPIADNRLTTLRAEGLDVAGVTDRDGPPLIMWHRSPTEAERAQANLILPGALHDA